MTFKAQSPSQRSRGNILISVLWVIVAMTIIVMGLSFEARSDMERTMLYRDRAKAYWLARAAVERVKYDWASSQATLIQQSNAQEERKMRYSYQFEEGTAECLIITNASKMSVNSTDPGQWSQLLTLYGLEDTERDETVDAILDWRDPGEEVRLNGCESEYYETLVPPYRTRNGPFFSIEEIMMVRGITESMFHGQIVEGRTIPGLKELLTTTSQGLNRFDINSCPEGILMAFLELSPQDAQRVIQQRDEKAFEDINEVNSIVSIQKPELLNKYFMTYRGANQSFTIRATGHVNGSLARYTVEDEVSYVGGSQLFRNVAHRDFSLEHVDATATEEVEP